MWQACVVLEFHRKVCTDLFFTDSAGDLLDKIKMHKAQKGTAGALCFHDQIVTIISHRQVVLISNSSLRQDKEAEGRRCTQAIKRQKIRYKQQSSVKLKYEFDVVDKSMDLGQLGLRSKILSF